MADIDCFNLRKIFHYDPLVGDFIYLQHRRRGTVGSTAGYIEQGTDGLPGYRVIQIECVRYYAHRLAWLYMTGGWPRKNIDHADRNKANNRWANLREATETQNKANVPRRRGRKYDLPKGVSFDPRLSLRPYSARLQVGRQRISLGHYASPNEASMAYGAGAKKYFGEFARGDS